MRLYDAKNFLESFESHNQGKISKTEVYFEIRKFGEFNFQGSEYNLILMHFKNQILQLRLSKQFSNYLIFLPPPHGVRVKNAEPDFVQNVCI